MFIHIGNKKIVSDRNIVGIFNIDTLYMSEVNSHLIKDKKNDDKSVIVDRKNNIQISAISSFTLITRTSLEVMDNDGGE